MTLQDISLCLPKLPQVELKVYFSAQEKKLEMLIQEGGGNLSAGALLRKVIS